MNDRKNFYYKKSLSALEFDKVRDLLSTYATIDKTKEKIKSLVPLYDAGCAIRMQKETTQACNMLGLNSRLPMRNLSDDIDLHIGKAVKGITLNAKDFMSILKLLQCSADMSRYRADNNADSSLLSVMFDRLYSDKSLAERITRTFPDGEHVADDASPELLSIRRAIVRESAKIKDMLDKYIRSAEISPYLQESIVTIRYDRYVIPVKAENRGNIKGLVHDTSNTGSTLFVEPLFVIDANNNIRRLENEEKQEIEKILKELTELVAIYAPQLVDSYKNLLSLDYIFAKARSSYNNDMVEPDISTDKNIKIKRARHPLISKDVMVPWDITMDKEADTIIVTGPNTGGKTVFLKTLGLMCIMAKAGMHLPCDEAKVFVFDKVFADIGDEQSIEQSLSTFSSHMKNIKNIISNSGNSCLVLFDELGSGTDPVEGAALAEAVIEKIRSAGSFCACTTHYSELKTFALETPGIKNASFEFDLETLSPTYRLSIGIPGKSYAFEISKHLGVQNDVITKAKSLVGTEVKRFDKVVDELLREKNEYENLKRELCAVRAELAKKQEKLDEKAASLEKNADRELENARTKARQVIEKARHDAALMMEELKKHKDELDKNSYHRMKSAIKSGMSKLEVEDNGRKIKEINPGDPVKKIEIGKKVYVPKLSKTGEIVAVSGNSIRVMCGAISINVKQSDLYEAPEEKSTAPKKSQSSAKFVRAVNADAKMELDIRGETVLDACDAIDRFLDNALLDHLNTVSIIHGKGTGALRSGVHAHLKGHRQVKTFRLGMYGEGDSGVTVVELK